MSFIKSSIITSLALLSLGQTLNAKTFNEPIKHVVLISIDGFHAFDLKRFVSSHPTSALAKLSKDGLTYSNAFSPAPGDSFPGLMALVTGGKPGQTGIYFDISYDRSLSPAGSDCKTVGTTVTYDETIDKAGVVDGTPLLDEKLLPRDPKNNCSPVFPHQYLKTNTIFDVINSAGGYTAWIDKHHVYEIVNGPHGSAVNDLYTPEIGEDSEGLGQGESNQTTSSINKTEEYDTIKMSALINQMNGFTHDKKQIAPIPMLAGMNFQAVNVAEKKAGYINKNGTPSHELEDAIEHCDLEIGKLVSNLEQKDILNSTLIVLTAKHGNGPVNPEKLKRIVHTQINDVINTAVPNSVAKVVSDRSAFIWLYNNADTKKVVKALKDAKSPLHIKSLLYGEALAKFFDTKKDNSRIPDIIIIPESGVIYIKPNDMKLAEHGGWDKDDRNVALLISNVNIKNKGDSINKKVSTTQVAPTILRSLGLDPSKLDAVREHKTKLLPHLF